MLRKRSVTIELRLKAQAEAKREAKQKLTMIFIRFLVGFLAVLAVFFIVATDVLARESVIEDINGQQLEKLIKAKDFVSVFWYTKNCKSCDEALEDLESIDDDAQKFSVDFVKVNDKRLAKTYNIRKFPSLTFFRNGEMTLFKGDVTNEAKVLEFLSSKNFLVIPDKIETVNAENLANLVAQEPFVTALFYDETAESIRVLNELEKIDDEADVFNIRFVKIIDLVLAEEYSLNTLPALVYFRSAIPIVYHGDLLDEQEVLEWLIQHQTSANEQDVLEKVSGQELDIMIDSIDHLVVLFHDRKKKSLMALEYLENIDDECDQIGVSFVKVEDYAVAKKHGADRFPSLIYYESGMPAVYDGDVSDHEKVLQWIVAQYEGSEIKGVSEEMLERMLGKEGELAVLFYNHDQAESLQVIETLETIMPTLEEENLPLVKSGKKSVAEDYGIQDIPALVLFENGVPNLFTGNLRDSDQVLRWLMHETEGDFSVEVVTDAMLRKLIDSRRHVAVLFYSKTDEKSLKIVSKIETIDHLLHTEHGVFVVKIDDVEEAELFGVRSLPGLVLFERGLANIYNGNLMDMKSIKSWIIKSITQDTIEEVTEAMLNNMLGKDIYEAFIVFVHHKGMSHDEMLLRELERLDENHLDNLGVQMVKLDDREGQFADKLNLDILPALVAIKSKDKEVFVFQGDIGVEHTVFEWIVEVVLAVQRNE